MAAVNELGVLSWKTNVDPHCLIPTIRGRNKMRIDRRSQSSNQIRQRIAEVAILSTSETMAFHHHVTAKDISLLVKTPDLIAFIRGQNTLNNRKAFRIKIPVDLLPGHCLDSYHSPII